PEHRRDSSDDLPSANVVDTLTTDSESPKSYGWDSSHSQKTDLALDILNSPLSSICGSTHQLNAEGAYMNPIELNDFSHLAATEYARASAGFGSTEALAYRTETLSTEPRERGLEEPTTPIDPLLVLSGDAATIGLFKSSIASDATVMEGKNMKIDHDSTRGCYQEDISQEEAYSVDCLLGRWGKDLFYLKWLDGSYGWEPRENILDDELLRQFEESYRGFKDGVEVLRTRIRN
ncbi:chromo domain-containing protein, partial [Fusarium mexicanum]